MNHLSFPQGIPDFSTAILGFSTGSKRNDSSLRDFCGIQLVLKSMFFNDAFVDISAIDCYFVGNLGNSAQSMTIRFHLNELALIFAEVRAYFIRCFLRITQFF